MLLGTLRFSSIKTNYNMFFLIYIYLLFHYLLSFSFSAFTFYSSLPNLFEIQSTEAERKYIKRESNFLPFSTGTITEF